MTVMTTGIDRRAARAHRWDAVVIGGGFYGCALALALQERRLRVLLIEQADGLLQRASFTNQARIHNGYHYPRAMLTALRSRVNLPRFTADFPAAVDASFTKLYAIARYQSRVSAGQFQRFCAGIGAIAATPPQALQRLFNPALIECVLQVHEPAFNAAVLREILTEQLQRAAITVELGVSAVRISAAADATLQVELRDGRTLQARSVFNCSYARLNTLLADSGLPLLPLKHEITEMALVQVPEALQQLGITVMDGPFFSVMPFPAAGLHSFSHVRYTPHGSWRDGEDGQRDPYAVLADYKAQSRFGYMLRDAQRFLPLIGDSVYQRSLFEVKTVLVGNEQDDGRPILARAHYGLPNLFVVMGGKIDNIYDVLAFLRPHLDTLEQHAA